jgi:DNA topoisomerase-1
VKKNIVQIVKDVANHLGNTPTICRKYYLHPAMIDAYTDKSLFEVIEQIGQLTDDSPYGLHPEEHVVMAVLRARAAAASGA